MASTGRDLLDGWWLLAVLAVLAAVSYGVFTRGIVVDGTEVVVYTKQVVRWKAVAVGAFGTLALAGGVRPVRRHPAFQGLVGAIALAGGVYGVSGAGSGRTSWLIVLIGAWVLVQALSAGMPGRRRPHA